MGDYALAPAVRYDSEWYLQIARDGYHGAAEPAFFPLYPLLVHAGGFFVGDGVPGLALIGVLLSLGALGFALVLLHRLTALELGEGAARRAVLLIAFFPTALFFSAVYTEALFLALEVGALYAGRRGHWAWAGVLGGLGAAARNSGWLLLLPLALLYLYGPREDAAAGARGPRWRPRFPLRPDAAWLLLVPAGLLAYLAYSAVALDGPLAAFHAQEQFDRSLVGPPVALWRGAHEALDGLGAVVGLGSLSLKIGIRNVAQLVIVVGAIAGGVAMLRRLPVAYGAWTLAVVAWSTSSVVPGHALYSTGRFTGVVFPLFMYLADRVRDRRAFAALLVVFAAGLVYFAAAFATWRLGTS